MVCAKQIVGWPVVDSEGRELGKVERLIITDKLLLSRLLIRREEGLAVVDIENVVFGDKLVWLAGETCFKSAQNGEESAYISLLGIDVVDIEGKVSGIAHDFVFDPVRKCVTGLEISDGLVADWLNGRQVVSANGLQYDVHHWIAADIGKEGAGV